MSRDMALSDNTVAEQSEVKYRIETGESGILNHESGNFVLPAFQVSVTHPVLKQSILLVFNEVTKKLLSVTQKQWMPDHAVLMCEKEFNSKTAEMKSCKRYGKNGNAFYERTAENTAEICHRFISDIQTEPYTPGSKETFHDAVSEQAFMKVLLNHFKPLGKTDLGPEAQRICDFLENNIASNSSSDALPLATNDPLRLVMMQ